ncbi:hypothetical protein LJC30_01525 [Odoribacter sp. OttesenSCG-928-L07]|nr:hypothetical protein [Odoribacter sp. OttesenSCG-928-L07]MDL2239666.1 hypothetical protein [Bacteroidales bacterium OttesenSCG-928-L14]MDL2240359.1 hypothetical protein [Bacteroidales bacterium OttesenSCG-928-K22]
MKKSLLFIFGTMCSILLFSQNDTVKYSVIKDDPYDIPKMYINISPLTFNGARTFYLGYNVGVNAIIADKFTINASFTGQYPALDLTLFSTSSVLERDFEYKKSYDFDVEFGLGYIISDKVRTEDATVVLNSNSYRGSNFTLISSTVIQTKSQFRRFTEVRLGGFYKGGDYIPRGNNVYATDGTMFLYYKYAEEMTSPMNGTVKFGDIDYENLVFDSYITEKSSKINGVLFTNATTMGGYIGIAFNNVKNLIIDVEDYGVRGISGYTKFYIDILGGISKLSPFEFYASNPNAVNYGDEISDQLKTYEIDLKANNIKVIPIGLRLGYEFKKPLLSKKASFEEQVKRAERLIYLSYIFEGGMKPSFNFVDGLYLKAGIALNINPF